MKKTLLFSLAAGALIAGATAATQLATRSGDIQKVEIAGFLPASGTTVSQISKVTIQLPASETMLEPYAGKIQDIIITNDDTDAVYKASEFGEPSMSDDEQYFNYEVLFETPITEKGSYTLSVPAGIFREVEWNESEDAFETKLGGAVNAAATASYTIGEDETPSVFEGYKFTPESGSTVESLESLKLFIPGLNLNSGVYNSVDGVEITMSNGTTTYYCYAQADWYYEEEEGYQYDIYFYPTPEMQSGTKVEITEAGTWTLTMPAGAFNYKGEDSPEMTATYTIEGAPKPGDKLNDYTLTPESGATLDKIDKLQLAFTDSAAESLVGKEADKTATIGCEELQIEYNVDFDFDFYYNGESGVGFNAYFYDGDGERAYINKAGTWKLYIEAGAFKAGNNLSPEITAEYTIEVDPNAPTKFDTYTFSPTEPVAVLSSANLIFSEYTGMSHYVMINDEAGEAKISNGETTYTAEPSLNDENWDEREYKFIFKNADDEEITIAESGEWTLTIPAGYFTDTQAGTASKAITGKFTVDADTEVDLTWTADPENGGKADMPQYTVSPVTFTFPKASKVSYTPTDDDATIRVTYNGESVKQVESIAGSSENNIGWDLSPADDGNQILIRLNKAIFDGPGILNITMDEGRFTIDGVASPEIEYSCTYGDYKELTYKLTPDGSEAVTSLSEFTLEFTNATTATIDEFKFYIALSQGQDYGYPTSPTVTEVKDAAHPTFKILFDMTPEILEILKPGYYTLMIDEGTFTVDGQMSPMIRQTYEYKSENPVDWTLTQSPEGDAVVALIDYVQIPYYQTEIGLAHKQNEAFGGADYSAIKVELDGTVLERGSEAGETVTYSYGYSNDSSVIYFTLMSLNSFTGTAKVTIPAGAITLSGEKNAEELVYTWNVVGAKEYTYTLTPDGKEPVDNLDTITVAFPEAVTGEVFNRFFIQFKDNNYRWLRCQEVETVADADCATFKMTFAPDGFTMNDIADGTIFNLNIRWGCFTLDGSQESPEVEQAYTYKKGSGLTLIPADADGKYTVFTLDGKVVLSKAAASALTSLEKGIYIINGKKIAIK